MNNIKKFSLLTFLALVLSIHCGQAQRGVKMIGLWTFEQGHGHKDKMGNFKDIKLHGAKIKDGKLVLGPKHWAQVIGFRGSDLEEKTLIAWVKLNDPLVKGGSIISLDHSKKNLSEGIKFNEKLSDKWLEGSDQYRSSADPQSGLGDKPSDRWTQIAMVIRKNKQTGGAEVSIYRNQEIIAQYEEDLLTTWDGRSTEVLFGINQTSKGIKAETDASNWVSAEIEIAAIYNGAISPERMADFRPKIAGLYGSHKIVQYKKGIHHDQDPSYQLAINDQARGVMQNFQKNASGTEFEIVKLQSKTQEMIAFKVPNEGNRALYLCQEDNRLLVKEGLTDASKFRPHKALGENLYEGWYTFESVAMPGHYLRNKENQLFLQRKESSPEFKMSASFKILEIQ